MSFKIEEIKVEDKNSSHDLDNLQIGDIIRARYILSTNKKISIDSGCKKRAGGVDFDPTYEDVSYLKFEVYCGLQCGIYGCQMRMKNHGSYDVQIFEQVLNKKRSNVSFDPGGFDSNNKTRKQIFFEHEEEVESIYTTHEIELFRGSMMIVNEKQVDFPFDPGGFWSKAKLEDEFS